MDGEKIIKEKEVLTQREHQKVKVKVRVKVKVKAKII